MNLSELKRVHFVGVGGIGMSGLSEVVASLGPAVSGCDLRPNAVTRRLETRGIAVAEGHSPAHVAGADLLVASSAVRSDNAEISEARERGVPVMRRAEVLGLLTRERPTVATAGTHGKTTTTAMVSLILRRAGIDPTLIVGGIMHDVGSNAVIGRGEWLVIEADEFDRSFLQFDSRVAIITNLEADHLDCYRDLDDLIGAFREFVSRIPEDGALLVCADDSNAPSAAAAARCRVIRYGTEPTADFRIESVTFLEGGSRFHLVSGNDRVEVRLHVPGTHNVLNAVAAIGAAVEVGVPLSDAARHMESFRGVERRFQRMGVLAGAEIVDDYAHHPTEIRATIQAARTAWPSKRIFALFQPHLYSRTRDFHREFGEALAEADRSWVLPIYPAREEPIEGVDSALIVRSLSGDASERVALLDLPLDEAAEHFRSVLGEGDVLITMGAGDVNRVSEMLAEVTA